MITDQVGQIDHSLHWRTHRGHDVGKLRDVTSNRADHTVEIDKGVCFGVCIHADDVLPAGDKQTN